MHRVWQAFKEGGWHGETAPAEFGGQQFPATVAAATALMFNAANTAANMYIAGATGAAGLIASFGDAKLKTTYLEKLYAGEWAGTMCLTEPQAGSSLSDVKTTAVKADGADYYLLTGTKCFISSGDHDLTREHRPSGARPNSRRAARREGHQPVHRAQVPHQRGRLAAVNSTTW